MNDLGAAAVESGPAFAWRAIATSAISQAEIGSRRDVGTSGRFPSRPTGARPDGGGRQASGQTQPPSVPAWPAASATTAVFAQSLAQSLPATPTSSRQAAAYARSGSAAQAQSDTASTDILSSLPVLVSGRALDLTI